MNNEVRKQIARIESDSKLQFEVVVRRPFVTVTIRDKKFKIYGAGHACVQMPDPWDEAHGIKQAKIRAVKDMLGISNPNLANIIAHEVSQSQATA